MWPYHAALCTAGPVVPHRDKNGVCFWLELWVGDLWPKFSLLYHSSTVCCFLNTWIQVVTGNQKSGLQSSGQTWSWEALSLLELNWNETLSLSLCSVSAPCFLQLGWWMKEGQVFTRFSCWRLLTGEATAPLLSDEIPVFLLLSGVATLVMTSAFHAIWISNFI